LSGEIIDFMRLDLLDDADEIGGIGHIAVVKNKPEVFLVGVLIEMVNPLRVEERGAALDAVHLVPLGREKFSQVGAVLAGDSCDERSLVHINSVMPKKVTRTSM
jgi:hypothetical protein